MGRGGANGDGMIPWQCVSHAGCTIFSMILALRARVCRAHDEAAFLTFRSATGTVVLADAITCTSFWEWIVYSTLREPCEVNSKFRAASHKGGRQENVRGGTE
jgi:hypothetical protein